MSDNVEKKLVQKLIDEKSERVMLSVAKNK